MRQATLSINATPEPVKKSKSLTVTGTLKRANWDTSKYSGYTKQRVQLQFRDKRSSGYKTVKTITSDRSGHLKSTVKAVKGGYWRYVFAGSTTTAKVVSQADYVDVK
ncbi:hypothetical protein [Streptomyces atratus]|uniref:hypothetical protein n=1 Tax=Streptomyces atratus TaxID=1893 RepID=UPI00379BF6C7